ncbi:hypothetical protein NDU88_007099 [Pleurodeles waltl]|uniref:Uncharacterized protein n=1 Tax=Pleurodeles waltl TaxID=8319 RepID=A0AAV7PNB2_PLEWA|nr:hypothetical protein NDU88_007099 [Pleurodeles waltl]
MRPSCSLALRKDLEGLPCLVSKHLKFKARHGPAGSERQPDEMEEILQRQQMAAEKHGGDKEWLRCKLDEELQEDLGKQQEMYMQTP